MKCYNINDTTIAQSSVGLTVHQVDKFYLTTSSFPETLLECNEYEWYYYVDELESTFIYWGKAHLPFYTLLLIIYYLHQIS